MPAPASLGKVIQLGVLTWLIPFVVSVPLVGRDGQPRLPVGFFKSLMIVVGAAVGAWLLVRVFRDRPSFPRPGLVIGTVWLGINLALDLLILVPLTGMRVTDYAAEIGLRYLIIPIMAMAIDSAGQTHRAAP